MTEKVTSIKVDPDLWKRAKLLAVQRGVTLKFMIESLLSAEVEVEETLAEELTVSEELLETLSEKRKRGKVPFAIMSGKSAVELVREGRGE